MQSKMLVVLAALALPLVSHAYTAAEYTNISCTAFAAGTTEQTVATNLCAPLGTLSSLDLPNDNCPLRGGFWVSTYPVANCQGVPTATTWFGTSTGSSAAWSATGSGVCRAVGNRFYKVTCHVTDNTTTTTELKFGLPWWFWLLLYCLCCCCCALCGGGGAIPFLGGGKKKPTKKPMPVSQPSVVEEVVTVEDEAAPMVTSGYPTASMAVPMASAAVPMTSGYGGYGAYPTATMAY